MPVCSSYQVRRSGQSVSFSTSRLAVAEDSGGETVNGHIYQPSEKMEMLHSYFVCHTTNKEVLPDPTVFYHVLLRSFRLKDNIECEWLHFVSFTIL